ncbi:hypothetical protein G3I44_16785 [Halogeometricum borinquense]|uniref:Uncharacterized protein n=2 Tax=Halogeometricum borinquense TaxID=60847 RepID=A0A6C0UJV3_9EURY|nr:hypothetical protein G3I44_16785 [Halogeometricum borinquense]
MPKLLIGFEQMPSRRDVLGFGSVTLALLAGCTSGSPFGGDTQQSPSGTEPAETTTPTPAPHVQVSSVSVAPSLVSMNSPDSIGTYGDRDKQFVIARIETDEQTKRGRETFSVATDGETYDSTPVRDVVRHRSLWGVDSPADRSIDDFVLFRVPKPLDAESVTIQWSNGEHRLNDEQVSRLNRPPTTFEVREFSAPDTVTSGTESTLTLTVENVGSADGTFVAGLNRSGPQTAYMPSTAISIEVDAGATATWTHSYTPPVVSRDGDISFQFVMNWRDGDERASVSLEPNE